MAVLFKQYSWEGRAMRCRMMAIFLAVVCVFSLECVEAGIKKETSDLISAEFLNCSGDFNDSLRERRAILESWIGAIDIDNPEAANVVEELHISLYLAEPAFSPDENILGIRTLEQAGRSKIISVVPLLGGDEKYGPAWEKVIVKLEGSSFKLDPLMLVVGNEKFSKFWRGISLLHQGRQLTAYVWREFEAVEDPFKNKVANEFYAHLLIFEILDQKGGEKYKKILSEKVKIIKSHFLKNKAYLSPDFSEAGLLNNAFNEAPLSSGEANYRWQILWTHATFMAMEELSNNDDKRERLQILYLEDFFKNQFSE